mgnify:CR=1 FL=1
MMRKGKRMEKVLPAVLAAALLAGCGRGEEVQPAAWQEDPVNLIYYTIGEPDTDLKRVEEALNELLLRKYGFTVSYNKIGWNDYEANLSSFLNTNQPFDIAFAWTENYLSNALYGNWLDLTPYMDTICTGTTYLRNAGKGGTGGGKCGKGPILGGFAAGWPRNRGGMSQLF